uniref:hypothetical protein n=1 Tax=Bacillus subtilis TaxID=1423 RepID=UPI001BDBAF4C
SVRDNVCEGGDCGVLGKKLRDGLDKFGLNVDRGIDGGEDRCWDEKEVGEGKVVLWGCEVGGNDEWNGEKGE